ncbi:dihydrofolate reductase family protein [Nocardia goodfellowii]|uniref:Dihydrofolate reductase n=1 Tax=Nocardia goodfellowii TaxID=882446 RepID=A0ABS4Q8G4_9NOCA|nr:dihydrofolate reductase family protein [Nocardia goodfellowii]MBP2187947.1 dihydrofolate reductase [Nocardia goodfellowii]
MRKLVYYVAVSLDGYIAGPNGEFDFYPWDAEQMAELNAEYPEFVPSHLRPHVGMAVDEPNKHFDTVIAGRGTWEPGLADGVTSPYGHMKQYVVSTTLRLDDPKVQVVPGDPVALVRRLKKEEGLDIYLCGGGNLAAQLLEEIDEMIIKSYPVVAGGGISAFAGEFAPTLFAPVERKEYDNGALVTWFTRA